MTKCTIASHRLLGGAVEGVWRAITAGLLLRRRRARCDVDGRRSIQAIRVEDGPDKGDEQPKHERHGRRLEGPLTHSCTPPSQNDQLPTTRECEEALNSSQASLMELMSLAILRGG
jgi:hypothetical protein